MWVLIPALLLAGGVTSSELFPPTGAKVSHLDDDQVGTKKGPRDLDIEMKLTRLNYRIFFKKHHFPFIGIDRNSSYDLLPQAPESVKRKSSRGICVPQNA